MVTMGGWKPQSNHGRVSLLAKNVLPLINKMFIPQIQILLLIPQQQKRTALHEAKYWLPCYYLWKHTCQNLVMGFMNFSLKYNTGKNNIVMPIL